MFNNIKVLLCVKDPRSLDPFYLLTYCIKSANISCTYCTKPIGEIKDDYLCQKYNPLLPNCACIKFNIFGELFKLI